MDEDFKLFIGFMAVAVISVFLITIVITGAANYFTTISSIAEIEQLRSDVLSVSVSESEDVIGQVTQWNQTIAMWKRQNQIPFICLIIPNRWDSVEPISIPQRSQ